MSTTRVSPLEAARGVLGERYAGARVLFLAGSVMRGDATPTSDLDVVVVFEELADSYRESFTFGGWPVEAFVNDVDSLRYFYGRERKRGVPSLMRMVIEGVEVPEASEFSAGLKREASEAYKAGPLPFDDAELQLRRYRLTDWVDDIRFPRSGEELAASGAWLYQDASDFFFRSRGLWSAHSKTVPRRMRETDAEFASKFLAAFEALFTEKRSGPVVALVEEMLAPFGGTLFDGFRMDARQREKMREQT
jgi:predicted nucleotidyltransferase